MKPLEIIRFGENDEVGLLDQDRTDRRNLTGMDLAKARV
jgi:hypothetical protein